jgi:hypothetical protein
MLRAIGTAYRANMRHSAFGGSNVGRNSLLVPSRLDVLPVFSRPTRPFHMTPPVQMGRRSAKIALRKVTLGTKALTFKAAMNHWPSRPKAACLNSQQN